MARSRKVKSIADLMDLIQQTNEDLVNEKVTTKTAAVLARNYGTASCLIGKRVAWAKMAGVKIGLKTPVPETMLE